MTLTLSHGPLSSSPPEAVNYRVDGPPHRLFFEHFPRRVRAMLGGETVADTTEGRLLHETGILPRFYIPVGDVAENLIEPTDHSTHCPFKGDASYWTVRAGERTAENAIWSYPEPLESAPWLEGYMSIYWDAMDEWYDEDERIEGHLRDPYHRVDVRASSRHVRVFAGRELIADSTRPKLLFETGVPNRFYLPRDDVRTDLLEPSETHSVCPYKGTASYWSLKVNGSVLEDAGWSYEEPLENAYKVPGHLCFLHEELRTEVAGK
jgi:uncharacterized protein (DUF427 family)